MKHLKPTLALLLSLVTLATACAATAEGLPYMEQLSQDLYFNTSLLTTDSYPEVCVSPYSFSGMYIGQYDKPYFIRFACPPNTFAVAFSEYSVSFVDMDCGYQYIYIGQDGCSYESFLDDCDDDEYILADGSEGFAMYIEPDGGRAFALLSAAEIEETAKLEIRVSDSSLDSEDRQLVIDALTAMIRDEVSRVQSTMTTERMDSYWTDGRYAGVTIISTTRNSHGITMTYTLPDGYFITNVDSETFSIVSIEGKDIATTVHFALDNYSYVNSKLENEPENVTTATIDGVEYRIYSHWNNDKILTAYVDCVISTTVGYNANEPLYLIMDIDPEYGAEWNSVEDVKATLATIVPGIRINCDQTVTDSRDANPYPATASEGA